MIPTVMIPGTLCDATVFDGVVAHLPGHDVQVADLSGYDSVPGAAAAVLARAQDRFLCLGFSLGGFVALEVLRRAPDRLLGVVLLAGNAHPDRPEMASVRRDQAERARLRGIEAVVGESIAAWGLADRPIVARKVVAMATGLGAEVFARHAEMNLSRPDHRDTARNSAVPLLVIAGAADPLCPSDRYTDAATGPRGRLVVLPGRGHYLPLEAPEEVARAVAAMELAV